MRRVVRLGPRISVGNRRSCSGCPASQAAALPRGWVGPTEVGRSPTASVACECVRSRRGSSRADRVLGNVARDIGARPFNGSQWSVHVDRVATTVLATDLRRDAPDLTKGYP